MSSAAETAKQPSDGDTPDAKRVKVTSKTEDLNSNADNNEKTTAIADSNNLKKSADVNPSEVVKTTNDNDDGELELDGDADGVTSDDLESGSESMDPNVTKRLQQVQSIQQKISKLNERASEEILQVEQKFNKLRRPHFEERNALLKDIDKFWVTCLANHPTTTQLIENPEDEDCLRYLVNLDVEELEDIKSGYNLKFYFRENPYIKNKLIVKELRHLNSDEVVSKSTAVQYNDTARAEALKTSVNETLRQYFGTGDRADHYSFFAWISLPCENGSDEIAEIIKDQIWPSPLEFFFHQQVDDSDDDDEDDSAESEYSVADFENETPGELLDEDLEGEELDDEEDGVDDDDDDGNIDEEDEE